MKNNFLKEYRGLDERFHAKVNEKLEYLVNFSQAVKEPIHRWYYYVEGYSPDLVKYAFKQTGVKKGSVVFDPFLGSGTTVLIAKENELKSFGFEINPFSALAVRVKTSNYLKEEIDEYNNFFLSNVHLDNKNPYEKYELKIISNLFDKNQLRKIEAVKKRILNVTSEKVRELLFFTLLSVLEDASNYRKGGNGLKKRKQKRDLDFFSLFETKKQIISFDISHQSISNEYEPNIFNDSCLKMGEYNFETIDLSLFSPPYANCFDPFEVYKVELWIGEFVKSYDELRDKRKRALTSNLNANLKQEFEFADKPKLLEEILNYLNQQKLWDKRLPIMLNTFFYEMTELLKMIYKQTKHGGYSVIVIGNSAYANLAIPTDIILGLCGEIAGFSVEKIEIARKNETSSQQHKKLGKFLSYMRESLVYLKKV